MARDAVFTRRMALAYGGGGIAACLLGSLAWQFRPTVAGDFPEHALGEGPWDAPRLLVVYASMMGSTAEQAEWIAADAEPLGWRTRLARAEEAPPPEGFDAVILGSAIRNNDWLDAAVAWASQHGSEMARKPHGLFQASMTTASLISRHGALTETDMERLRGALGTLHQAAPSLRNSPVAFLPGCLEYGRLTPKQRMSYALNSGSLMYGDFRDPGRVHSFTTAELSGFEG